MKSFHFSTHFACLLSLTLATKCTNPDVKTNVYTTQDGTILTHIAYICEFSVKCTPISASISHLYALLDETISPVATVAPNKYQISWTEELKNARTGEISVKIFDDEGYAQLRKALRSGESLGNVTAFFTVKVNHPGIYKGQWISCELLAGAFCLFIAYYAFHFKWKF